MQEVNERVLSAWIKLFISLDTERIPSLMPFNEAGICNLLASNEQKQLTATDLCGLMRMQKSQMNRTLTSLEEKGLIERIRCEDDKRQMIVRYIPDPDNIFVQQHEKNLKVIERFLTRIGYDRAEEIIELFTLISDIAQEEII